MNKISSSTLNTKIRELVPNLPKSISPEVLNRICEDESVQPFLKWFCANISCDNVLSDECTQLKKHIKSNDTWLERKELDLALNEATKDCPELLNLIKSDYWDTNQSFVDFTTEKELYDPDCEYLELIEDSIKKLKECEEQLDNNLEKENDTLKKEEIKVKLTYESCASILEGLDSCHHEFSKAIELLSHTYSNAVQNKGEPCLWTQMPIELFIKQLETYNIYLNSYVKRQFSVPEKDEDINNEEHSSFLSDSCKNEKLNELKCCQKNLFTSKMQEIIAKVQCNASSSLLNYITDVYNNGNLKAPSTPVLTRAEIAELTKNRDILEESVGLLEEQQLVDIVQQYAKVKTLKILRDEAEARLQRRKDRLLRLQKLCTLAKEHGYAFSTLLCMLFELQIHRINEIVQFVIDARHYLSMEYSLSTERNESIQKLQNEYTSMLASQRTQNAFCQTFIDIAALDNSKENFQASMQYYDNLKIDNNNKLKILLDEKLTEVIESTKILETTVIQLYKQELTSGPTLAFRTVPYHVQNELDKTVKQVDQLETNIELIKNKLKTMIKETKTPSFEREQLLLWQKFLVDPESLKNRYNELENLRDRTMF